MKSLITLLTVATCLLLGSVRAGAQNVAYVSSEAIFQRLPKAIEARGKLGEMQAKWMNEIRTLEKRSAALRQEIEQNRLLWSAHERERKEGELRNVEAELLQNRSSRFGPNGEFEQLYQTLMTPVIQLVMVAIRAEAEAQKYDFVFDKSTRGLPLLFANPDHDLTYRVLVRLGVEVDPSELQEREEEGIQILPESLPFSITPQGGSTTTRPTEAPPTEPIEVEDPNRLIENEDEPE